ncbi:hypothetical protein F5Y12DRAFT_294879 [Xylaria sp. FL1777]|nr:hypothetical protein F5Y12DRAFT_294879 [Xylaria sp. FL1777]
MQKAPLFHFLSHGVEPPLKGIAYLSLFIKTYPNLAMASEFNLVTRTQALTLHSEGYSRAVIIQKTGYSASGLSHLISKAKKHGYKPGKGPILHEYVETKPRKGRPSLSASQKAKVITLLESDIAFRKSSTQKIANRINEQNPLDPPISRRSVLRILTQSKRSA